MGYPVKSAYKRHRETRGSGVPGAVMKRALRAGSGLSSLCGGGCGRKYQRSRASSKASRRLSPEGIAILLKCKVNCQLVAKARSDFAGAASQAQHRSAALLMASSVSMGFIIAPIIRRGKNLRQVKMSSLAAHSTGRAYKIWRNQPAHHVIWPASSTDVWRGSGPILAESISKIYSSKSCERLYL